MSWQDEYKSKLMTAEGAVKKVKSNDVVGFGLSLGAPTSHLVDALLARAGELTRRPNFRCCADPADEIVRS